jgi:hypothetical protein
MFINPSSFVSDLFCLYASISLMYVYYLNINTLHVY